MKLPTSFWRLTLGALPLGWLWWVLLNDLRVEWTVNPQYAYGWAVPFLCGFLLWRQIFQKPVALRPPPSVLRFPSSALQFIFWLLALLYLPTRLIQEANPGWRLVSWALAIETIGLTLGLLGWLLRDLRLTVRDFVFPLGFFLVAVPWPTLVESPLIQTLTRFDVLATCEFAGWLGIPAIPHGNVIQVATGLVGIDDACSGIRSFQATLMISLFVGKFYSLSWRRRTWCVLAGFSLAVGFNLVRQIVLVWVAAREGVPAIAKWHDPTGVIILLGCFLALWGMGVWLAGSGGRKTELCATDSDLRSPTSVSRPPPSALRLPLLLVWLVLVEVGVASWYRWHEARLPAATVWQVNWPTNNATFADNEIAAVARQILRYDAGRNAIWQEDNLGWQIIFLEWQPGRAAVRLAQNHTPEVCLAALGHKLAGGRELQQMPVRGLKFPFRFYQLTDTPQPVFVAYCLWDDRAGARQFETSYLSYRSRLAAVRAGQRSTGQRSLEIALTGVNDLAAAQTAVQALLEKIIAPGP